MQVFISELSVVDSVKVLDNKRLNKQILEVYQLIRLIKLVTCTPYINHAVTRMYWNNLDFLSYYMYVCGNEYVSRFPKTTHKLIGVEESKLWHEEIAYPNWWYDEKIHDSHKGMLYNKNPEIYAVYELYKDIQEYRYPLYNKGFWYNGIYYIPEFTDKKYWWLGFYRDIAGSKYDETIGKKYKPESEKLYV